MRYVIALSVIVVIAAAAGYVHRATQCSNCTVAVSPSSSSPCSAAGADTCHGSLDETPTPQKVVHVTGEEVKQRWIQDERTVTSANVALDYAPDVDCATAKEYTQTIDEMLVTYRRGIDYLAAGNYDDALADFQNYRVTYGEDAASLLALGLTYGARGNFTKQEEYLYNFRRTRPKDSKARKLHAHAEWLLKQAEVSKNYQPVLSMYPWSLHYLRAEYAALHRSFSLKFEKQ